MTNLECNNTVTPEQLATAATEQAAFFRAMNKTEQANTLQALAQCIRDLLEDKYELQTSYDVLGGVKELLRMEKERLDAEAADLLRQIGDAQAEKNRLVRDLDVLWNGEEGAAKQASLCDIVAQISKELPLLREAQARLAELEGRARRYSFIREHCHTDDDGDGWMFMGFDCIDRLGRYNDLTVEQRAQCLDAAIDAAMLAASPGGQNIPPDSPAHRAAKVLRDALESMNKAYVRLLESGRNRIVLLGGDCDPVDVMESNDHDLRVSRKALATAKQIVEGGE